MQDEKQKKEELLEMLRAEVARLLCADDVSEEELLVRGPPPPAIGPLTQVRK